MEAYIPLDLIKKHLNLDEWFEEDDQYLEHLCLVAQNAVENHIGYSLEETLNELGLLPKPLEQALLLLIGGLYNHRENMSELTIKDVPAYSYLLQYFKNYRYND